MNLPPSQHLPAAFKIRCTLVAAFTTLCLFPGLSKAQVVISNPAVVTGSGAVNPDNEALGFFSGTDATLLSNLETDSQFKALQDYSGFTGMGANNETYTVDFAAGPDVRFTYDSNIANAVTALNNALYAVSGNSAMRFQGSSINTATSMTISFGTSNGSSGFTGDQSISGLGFTLTGNYANTTGDAVTVTYSSIGGSFLSTQTYTNTTSTKSSAGTNAPVNAFTGYINTTGDAANNVGSINISFTTNGGAGPFIFGLDDFGFTTASSIPEPSTYALLGGLAGLTLVVSRRRHVRD